MLNLLLNGQIITFVIITGLLIIALSFHEASHGFVAYKLGDSTAKNMGRLTLNPLAHLDPLGTLLLLFVGFGWGKPVPVNPYNFNNIRRDSALVALAGPASNLAMAIIASIIVRLLSLSDVNILYFIENILKLFVYYNLLLGLFNLIPLGPLDGFKIVSGFLPTEFAIQWEQNQMLSMMLLVVILFLPINGVPVVNFVLSPAINFLLKLLVGAPFL